MEVILNDLYQQEFFDYGGIVTFNEVQLNTVKDLENLINYSNLSGLKCKIGKYNYTYNPNTGIFTYSNLRNFLDPKDPYGIPNVNFTCINEDDHRWEFCKQERLERGFDHTELWNLEYTIAKFIYPRIKEFAENHAGYPGHLTEERWQKILNEITEAFRLYIEYDDLRHGEEENEEINKKIDRGLELFIKYFRNLWD